jgi:8-oxo-dGTP diphosphatase
MTIGRFYGGIGAVIWSPAKQRDLLLRRAASKDFAPGVWECVTGRVDQGEGFEDAVCREVREELGVNVTITFIIGTTHFYRGATEPENEMLGVVYGCTVDETTTIRLSAEHSEYRWVTFQEANALLTAPDPSTQWLRRVLARAEIIRGCISTPLLQYYQEIGFEVG